MNEQGGDITLLCEDDPGGRSQRMIEDALQALRQELPLAVSLAPRGVGSKNDVQQRLRWARANHERVVAVRDRDFMERSVLENARARAFSRESPVPWPLSRHSIESYLLDEELAQLVGPTLVTSILAAARDRRWLDIGRATLEDFHFRFRRGLDPHRQLRREPALQDRESVRVALLATMTAAERFSVKHCTEDITARIDEFDRDFDGENLLHRVDGKELLGQLEGAHPNLVNRLELVAKLAPSRGLRDDLKQMLDAMSLAFRIPAS